MSKNPPFSVESLGRRIASNRARIAMTQQQLAERVAISRVALSNLESGRSVPGERTVALLAGVFAMEPHELVADTDYPSAKADRLPMVTARHTEAAMLEALCRRDLMWLEGSPYPVAVRVLAQWRDDLREALSRTHDSRELDRLSDLLALVLASDPDCIRS